MFKVLPLSNIHGPTALWSAGPHFQEIEPGDAPWRALSRRDARRPPLLLLTTKRESRRSASVEALQGARAAGGITPRRRRRSLSECPTQATLGCAKPAVPD